MKTQTANLALTLFESYAQQLQFLTMYGPLDLTDYQVDAHIRERPTGPLIAQFSASITNPTQGIINLELGTDTAALLTGSCYIWDLRLSNGDEVSYPIRGKLTVRQAVTRD